MAEHSAENDAPAHDHYWSPIPAYMRKGTESARCGCGATWDQGSVIPPEVTSRG